MCVYVYVCIYIYVYTETYISIYIYILIYIYKSYREKHIVHRFTYMCNKTHTHKLLIDTEKRLIVARCSMWRVGKMGEGGKIYKLPAIK